MKCKAKKAFFAGKKTSVEKSAEVFLCQILKKTIAITKILIFSKKTQMLK